MCGISLTQVDARAAGKWRSYQPARSPEIGVREIALEIAPDARHVAQVAGLAVALGEPREDAEDLGVALRAERGVGKGECGTVESGSSRGDAVRNSARTVTASRSVGDVDAGVLQQRDEVVGRRAEHGILEIDDADARDAVALRQPHQVRRVVVAQHPAARAGPASRSNTAFHSARNSARASARRWRRRSRAGQYQSAQQLGLDHRARRDRRPAG